MKIDVYQVKLYIKSLEAVIAEYKAKGRDTDFFEGQLAAFNKIIQGEFEEV